MPGRDKNPKRTVHGGKKRAGGETEGNDDDGGGKGTCSRSGFFARGDLLLKEGEQREVR